VTGLPPWERGVALVHQMPGLLPHMSILENVALAAELRGRLPRWEARREAARLLERLGVAGVADRRPVEVSGGQLQRAALAAALAARPRLLLLDEPLSHLDRSTAEAAAELLSRLPREEGVAVLHVTHDLDEALRLAEEITVLHAGRVAETGEAGRVYTCPRSLEAAELLGFNLLHDAAWLGLGGCVAVHPEAVEPLPHPRGGWRLRGMWRERGRVLVELEWRGSSLRLRGYVDPWLAWELRRAGAARLRLRGGVCRLASC
ncbi:MAG: ATP-binding cassette domain-containing protein, partial [Crenarchaeota archaeon]|nr:ATP-binding cassette domain-containing protein [Thermoproteota archaeon]